MNCRGLFILFLFSCSYCFSYAQEKPQLVTTTGHQGRIESLSFSSNGRYVASTADKTVKIYDMVMQLEFNSLLMPSTNTIQQVKFSSDNKYIFALAISEFYTISHPEGKIVERKKIYASCGTKDKCFIGPDDKFYFPSDWNGLTVYDPIKGEIEKHWKDIRLINVVYLSGKNVFIGREKDPADKKKFVLSVFNASSGERIKSIPVSGKRFGLFKTDKKEEHLFLEADSIVSIFNSKTLSLITQLKFPGASISDVEIYPDGKKVMVSGYDGALIKFDIATGKQEQKYTAETLNEKTGLELNMAVSVNDIEFSPNGKLLAVPFQSLYVENKEIFSGFRLGYFGVSDMRLKHKYEGQLRGLRSVILNKDESKMITLNHATPNGSKVWDLKKGEIEYFHSGPYELKLAEDRLIVNCFDKAADKYYVRTYEFSTMKLLQQYETEGFSTLEISSDGKLLAAMVNKFSVGQGLAELTFSIRIVDSGKELYSRKVGLADHHIYFRFNKTNQLLLYERNNSDTFNIDCIDPLAGKIIDTSYLINNSKNLIFFETDKSGDEQFFSTEGGIKFFEIKSKNIKTGVVTTHIHEDMHGSPLVMRFNHDYTKLALFLYEFNSPKIYKVFIYDWLSKQRIKVIDDLSYPVSTINFGQKTGDIYLGDDNGILTVFGSDYEKKTIFLTEREKDYLILTPDNYYKTSITSTQGIGFRYKNELYRFDQFDLRYNRPDLVMKGLGVPEAQVSLYKDAWLKRLKRLGFDEQTVNSSSIHAPEISVVGKDNLPYSTLEGSIKFTINASDSLYDLKRVALYVNNVPVYGKNGFAIPGKDIRKYKKDIEVFLGAGRNKITVSVFNSQGAESTRESFVIECTKKFTKPDLYVFAVGVSKYKDSTMNLTYSDKDVNDIVSVFTENNKISQRYGNVYVKLLTNTEATVSNVDAASVFLKNSKPDDQVILFFSGHGLIDQKLDYYLAMSNVDFTNPSSGGLLYSHFQDLFDGLQSRKRLLLIDACHSGEYDKEDISQPVASNSEDHVVEKEFQFRGKKVIGIGNANELVKELFTDIRKETGATVIASSSGTEYSVESSIWKNGAFTYALKDGLSDLKADRNNDKEITLSETREYLIQKVKELTGGKQNPTTRQENIEFDYRLW